MPLVVKVPIMTSFGARDQVPVQRGKFHHRIHRDLAVLLDQAHLSRARMNPCINLGIALMKLVVGRDRRRSHLLKRRPVGEKFRDTSAALIYFFVAKYHNFLAIKLKYFNECTPLILQKKRQEA
jgi:hypothetical protein